MDEPEKAPIPNPEGEVQATAPAATKRSSGFIKWIVLVVVVLGLGAADQVTKQWAQDDLQQRPGRSIQLASSYIGFTYVRNPGAAWGFLSGPKYASFRRPFFISISIVAMVFIGVIFFYLQRGQGLLMTALSLIMSGAVGNFIDRIRLNYVIDFIDVRIPLPGGSVFYWPKFNVADVAITLGVLVLLLEMFIGKKPEDESDEEPDDEVLAEEDLDWDDDDDEPDDSDAEADAEPEPEPEPDAEPEAEPKPEPKADAEVEADAKK